MSSLIAIRSDPDVTLSVTVVGVDESEPSEMVYVKLSGQRYPGLGVYVKEPFAEKTSTPKSGPPPGTSAAVNVVLSTSTSFVSTPSTDKTDSATSTSTSYSSATPCGASFTALTV